MQDSERVLQDLRRPHWQLPDLLLNLHSHQWAMQTMKSLLSLLTLFSHPFLSLPFMDHKIQG